MYKNKTAKPISVSYCVECCDEHGCYLGETAVVLNVQGDCISKVYKGKDIESLNPPIAKGGTIYSVKYEAEKDSIRKNGRNDMLILTAVGTFCVMMSESVSGLSVGEMLFNTGIVGQLLFGYLVFCVVTVIYVGFIKGMRR